MHRETQGRYRGLGVILLLGLLTTWARALPAEDEGKILWEYDTGG